MTNFYAYINRHNAREDQAIYEAELERKSKRRASIESYFTERIYTGHQITFETVALSSLGVILKDDIASDYWIASWDKTASFRLYGFKRCNTLEEAKVRFFELSEGSP